MTASTQQADLPDAVTVRNETRTRLYVKYRRAFYASFRQASAREWSVAQESMVQT